MTPEEKASRRRHPTHCAEVSALRAVHSDTHNGGQAPRPDSETPARGPSPLAVAAVVQLAVGAIVAAWSGSWRVLVTAVAVFLVLAIVGAYLERRPR